MSQTENILDYQLMSRTSNVPLSLRFGNDALTYNTKDFSYSATLQENLQPCLVSANTVSLSPRFVTVTDNNASFTITYNSQNYTGTLAQGSWSFNDISDFIAQFQIQNNLFLTNNLLQTWTPITLAYNITQGLSVLTTTPVISPSPTGWVNSIGLTLTGFCPQIAISSELSTLLGGGYSASKFPSGASTTTTQTQLSNNNPQNLFFNTKINILSPPISQPYTPINSAPSLFQVYSQFSYDGSIETFQPVNRNWYRLSNNGNQNFTFNITDMNGRPVQLANPASFFLILDIIFEGANSLSKLK